MPNHMSPTELARHLGVGRRDVIGLAFEMGVPIFQGRIDVGLFEASLEGRWGGGDAAHYVLFDSAGNMIESYGSLPEAAASWLAVPRDERSDVELIAFDAAGKVVGPASGSRESTRA
jgi:hypothetical protein